VTLPCVRAATLDGYVELGRSCGFDPSRLMSGVGLDVADLAVPDKWISAGSVARLLELSAAEAGRDDFGLRMAEYRRLATLGPLSVVLREEPDLRRALRLLVRYEHSYNEALRLRLTEANGLATITLWFEFAEPAPTRQALDLAVATLLGIIRAVVRETWEPLTISFSHGPPARTDTLLRLLGPRVQFDQQFTGLVFYASELDAKNTMADPLLQPYSRQFLRSLPSRRAAGPTDEVRRRIELLLPLGRCSVDHVARSLGITRRTLHRHLTAQGTTFSDLVDTTRAGLSERYLANDRYSMTDISQLLGFAAPSAFSRWFRQRFEISPTDWRARARRSRVG
jgi:AraC-like DNA-binding protein